MIYDNNDKGKPYFKSLMNIINYLIYNKSETEEKELIKNRINKR